MIINLVVLFISFAITYLLIKYKNKINLQADINYRSLHKSITPNSGGIAIFISSMLGLYLFNIELSFALLVSIIFVFLIGIYDDMYGASSKQKILLLFLVANILFFNNFYIEYLGIFFGQQVYIDGIVAYFFIVFAIIGFVNAFNLIDGIDGLASIVAIIILSSFLYIGIKFHDSFLISISSVYICSILGYLYFNWSPAKIFMGDSGSLVLGFIIAILSIYAVNKHFITPVTTLMLAAIPILDTFLVMTRRILNGQSPFVADKLHMHHIILRQQKNNTKKTVIIIGLMQFIFTYIGLGFKIRDDVLILFLFIILFLLFYLMLTPNRKKLI